MSDVQGGREKYSHERAGAFVDTAQKMFSINVFSSKCEQISSFLRIWSHLLKKSLMENFIFLCSVNKREVKCLNIFFRGYLYGPFRSSRPEVFCKKGVHKNFTKFTEKHLCQSLFFNNVAGLWPATLLKKRL